MLVHHPKLLTLPRHCVQDSFFGPYRIITHLTQKITLRNACANSSCQNEINR